MIYVINDLYIYKGTSLRDKPLLKRIELLKNIFNNQYNNDVNLDPCTFIVKDFFEYNYLKSLKDDYSKKINYRTSGFMFIKESTINETLIYIYPENRNKNSVKKTTYSSKLKKLIYQMYMNYIAMIIII